MFNDLQTMETMWLELRRDNLTAYKRRELYVAMVALYRKSTDVKNNWEHHPSQHCYKDRFKRCIRIRQTVQPKNVSRRIRKNNAFDDGINYDTPAYSGLYLIGSTYFNPITDEKYYWIKVGRANNIDHRMSKYNTCCAMLYRIDYKCINDDDECKEAEILCHEKLFDVSLATCNHNREWFLVDRETYLEICGKGFSYFN